MFSAALGSHLTRRLAEPGRHDIDSPQSEGDALVAADSVSWRVFKNPVALFVGGVAAVLLELAEPRVRTGVWEHSSFRTDPVRRMKRTGLAAMVTVYGARSIAERMITGVRRMHGQGRGHHAGAAPPTHANDPGLLDWVQATAAFGFLEAYCTFVTPLPAADRDRFYAEGAEAAAALRRQHAPRSVAEQQALFAAMMPKLEASDIVFEFLDIVQRAPILPRLSRPAQSLFIRAAVEIVPPEIRARARA